MASPRVAPSHPLTPPAEPTPPQPPQPTTSSNPPTQIEALLSQPLTSASDDGKSRRPRDHRLIHLLLASHGIAAYQERVPLQLMDFAYRYTSSVLGDALHIQAEGYDSTGAPSADPGGKGRGGGAAGKKTPKEEEGDVSLKSLRLAIANRMSYQFQNGLPKEFLKSLAEERNRVGLGALLGSQKTGGQDSAQVVGGVKLPPEKYCLTGVAWGLKDSWESEGEEEVEVQGAGDDGGKDVVMGPGGEDDFESMEDVFGDALGDGGGGDGDDIEMGDI